jgi:hypothetical protein
MVVIAPIVASSTMRMQMPEDPNKESTQNTAVTLHYIDKLFAARSASLAAAQRLSLSALVLSIVLLSLSGGAAVSEGALTVAGLSLKVPLTVFLTAGAVIVAIFLAASRQTWSRDATLWQPEIRRLYKSIGFADWTLDSKNGAPFATGDVFTMIALSFGGDNYEASGEQRDSPKSTGWLGELFAGEQGDSPKSTDWLGELFATTVSFIIPTAAQAAVGFKVSELLRPIGLEWIWVLFVLLVWATTFGAFGGRRYLASVNKAVKSKYAMLRMIVVVILATSIILVNSLPGIAIGYFVAKVLSSA